VVFQRLPTTVKRGNSDLNGASVDSLHPKDFEDHLEELIEGDLAIAVEVDFPKYHLPLTVANHATIFQAILLVNGCYQTINDVGRVLRFGSLFLLFPTPKHLLDLISSNKAGLIAVKHVEYLAKAILIHNFGRVQLGDEEL
jgi:hypothetical protein